MPELPDIELYREALCQRLLHQQIISIRIRSPFFLRTVEPPLKAVEGREVIALRRMGKRIVIGLEDDLFLLLHLMIAGRLQWRDEAKAKMPGKIGLAAIDTATGTLLVTEASSRKRAAMSIVQGANALAAHDPGGLETGESSVESVAARLRSANHTLKRALTHPRLFSGIGNAYSDEILHAAGLSPLARTASLSDDEIARLHAKCCLVLEEWTARLREEFADRFPGPGDVTAFRPDFNVHGKAGEPCRVCGSRVQRIRYADRETNYCPGCQTNGTVYADRALSRLLKDDWPKTIEEWEAMFPPA